jgi:hypothetical protein
MSCKPYTALDNEGKKFDFYCFLKNSEKLLEDLKWLKKAEAAKGENQTLLQAMLAQPK